MGGDEPRNVWPLFASLKQVDLHKLYANSLFEPDGSVRPRHPATPLSFPRRSQVPSGIAVVVIWAGATFFDHG
jgi:hypothetical protein